MSSPRPATALGHEHGSAGRAPFGDLDTAAAAAALADALGHPGATLAVRDGLAGDYLAAWETAAGVPYRPAGRRAARAAEIGVGEAKHLTVRALEAYAQLCFTYARRVTMAGDEHKAERADLRAQADMCYALADLADHADPGTLAAALRLPATERNTTP